MTQQVFHTKRLSKYAPAEKLGSVLGIDLFSILSLIAVLGWRDFEQEVPDKICPWRIFYLVSFRNETEICKDKNVSG